MRKPSPPVAMLLTVLLITALAWYAGAVLQHDRANRALIAAIKSSNTTAAIAALDAGADPNGRDDGGLAASTWRHLRNRFERLRGKSTQPGDDYEPTSLIVAFECKSVPNTSICIIPSENVAVVRVLLDRGADINARDINGKTALLSAISDGYAEIVPLLLDHGANVNVVAQGASPGTPLTTAVIFGKTNIVKWLLDRGAYVNLPDSTGCTPLIYASECRYVPIVRMLLERGADVNDKEPDGWTVLMRASEGGDTDTVRVVLDKGADVNRKNEEGASALKLAAKEGHREIVRLLEKAGAR